MSCCSIGAGTGLLYLLRWFWWRVSAWCEVVAMAASLVSAGGFALLTHQGLLPHLGFAETTIIQVGLTSALWLLAAFIAPQTERAKLIEFYRKVHPAGPGWKKLREEAGVTVAEAALHGDHMGKATIGWVARGLRGHLERRCFPSGIFFTAARGHGAGFFSGCLSSAVGCLLYIINHLWSDVSSDASAAAATRSREIASDLPWI